jgi:hypothetical protein
VIFITVLGGSRQPGGGCYTDELAPALTADRTEPLREHTARQAVDAADIAARHYAHTEPDQAIAVLEHAITVFARYTEPLYQSLIRLHRQQGRPDAASRALDTLARHLAELDAQPSRDTTALATSHTAS